MSMRTVKVGSLAPGVNNRLEPTELATRLPDRSAATYLYGADNVDINQKGYLKRRHGQTLRDATACHSLWADDKGAFRVKGTDLVKMSPQGTGFDETVIRADLPRYPLSYSRGADGDVYWSNGQILRRITAAGDAPAVTEPPLAPTIALSTGALVEGAYLLAFTIEGPDGESPATSIRRIQVPKNGGVAITSAAGLTTYMSGPNGDVLTAQGVGDTVIVTHNETSRRCMTLNRAPMPAGSIVRHYLGSMLVAQQNILFISDPYNYGVYDPSRGYVPLPAKISVVEPTDNGIYVVADKTYWIGKLFEDSLQEVLPYGGVPGTGGRDLKGERAYWMSDHGLVLGDKNMSVQNVQEEALDLAPAAAGATLYREMDGMTHIIASRVGTGPSVGVASSFMEAEIVRKGTIV